jgi:hypothetical protein
MGSSILSEEALSSDRGCGQIIIRSLKNIGHKFLRGHEMRSTISFRFTLIIAILAIVAAALPTAHADQVSHVRIVRLSFVEGDVAYQRPGSSWERAVANLPLQQGFSLRTDAGYAEVEFETGLVVHLAGNTQLEFTELSLMDGRRVTSLKLDQGTIIAAANLQHGDTVSIASGNAQVTVPRSGRIRIDSVESQNWVTVFHGKADVTSGASSTAVDSGKTLHFAPASQAGEQNQSSVERSPRTDAFDKWAAEREQALQDAQSDNDEFVTQRNFAFSTADLYNYGLWSNISGYGMAWQPYGMGPNWMPFGNGMWTLGGMDADWLWTSFEPWGWLPYHYGGWVNIPGDGWFWIPQDLGNFRAATANFVFVGDQFGWTPIPAMVTFPRKVRSVAGGPVQVVFPGSVTRGVIVAGPRGVVAPTTVRIATRPGSTVLPTAPNVSTLATSGVKVTSLGPAPSMRPTLTYTAHGTGVGNPGGGNGTRVNHGAPGTVNGPIGRPTAQAPHSAPVSVTRPPSTFASQNPGGRNTGVTPVHSSGAAGGNNNGTLSAGGGSGAAGSSNGGGSGRPAGTGSAGGTAPSGPAPGGAAGGGVAPTSSGTVKH